MGDVAAHLIAQVRSRADMSQAALSFLFIYLFLHYFLETQLLLRKIIELWNILS